MSASINIDISFGPTLRAAMDVLDLGVQLRDAIPDWHPQRAELIERLKGLQQRINMELRKNIRDCSKPPESPGASP
jgi:hypothetical protein